VNPSIATLLGATLALTHWSEAVVKVFSSHYMNWLLGDLVCGLDISGVFIYLAP